MGPHQRRTRSMNIYCGAFFFYSTYIFYSCLTVYLYKILWGHFIFVSDEQNKQLSDGFLSWQIHIFSHPFHPFRTNQIVSLFIFVKADIRVFGVFEYLVSLWYNFFNRTNYWNEIVLFNLNMFLYKIILLILKYKLTIKSTDNVETGNPCLSRLHTQTC